MITVLAGFGYFLFYIDNNLIAEQTSNDTSKPTDNFIYLDQLVAEMDSFGLQLAEAKLQLQNDSIDKPTLIELTNTMLESLANIKTITDNVDTHKIYIDHDNAWLGQSFLFTQVTILNNAYSLSWLEEFRSDNNLPGSLVTSAINTLVMLDIHDEAILNQTQVLSEDIIAYYKTEFENHRKKGNRPIFEIE